MLAPFCHAMPATILACALLVPCHTLLAMREQVAKCPILALPRERMVMAGDDSTVFLAMIEGKASTPRAMMVDARCLSPPPLPLPPPAALSSAVRRLGSLLAVRLAVPGAGHVG